MNTSAPWMAEQCQDAYERLLDAEMAYATSAQQAVQNLSRTTVRAAMVARIRWRIAVREAVLATDRLGDSDLRPEDLELGHAVVDCWNPKDGSAQKNPAEGDLAATPNGELWVARAGHLLHGIKSTKLTTRAFHNRGGVLLTHHGRWIMVEEALISRFPVGTSVEESSRGRKMRVTCPDVGAAISADRYFPHGRVHTDQGWWGADALEPAC